MALAQARIGQTSLFTALSEDEVRVHELLQGGVVGFLAHIYIGGQLRLSHAAIYSEYVPLFLEIFLDDLLRRQLCLLLFVSDENAFNFPRQRTSGSIASAAVLTTTVSRLTR